MGANVYGLISRPSLVIRRKVVPSLFLISVPGINSGTSFVGYWTGCFFVFWGHLICVMVAIWRHAAVVYLGFVILLGGKLEKNAIFSLSGRWGESTVRGLTVT